MSAHGAAPGELAGKLRGDAQLNGNACSLSRTGLSEAVVSRLAAAGVRTLADWVALGRKRLDIFGITKRMAELIDQRARDATQETPAHRAPEARCLFQRANHALAGAGDAT